MRFVEKSDYLDSFYEIYDLDKAFSKSEDNKGLAICYALASCVEIDLTMIELEAAHEEIGVPLAWHIRKNKELFFKVNKTLKEFLNNFDDDDFGSWSIKAMYCGTEISIHGRRKRTVIRASYSKEHPVDLAPLFERVETMTRELVHPQ